MEAIYNMFFDKRLQRLATVENRRRSTEAFPISFQKIHQAQKKWKILKE